MAYCPIRFTLIKPHPVDFTLNMLIVHPIRFTVIMAIHKKIPNVIIQ